MDCLRGSSGVVYIVVSEEVLAILNRLRELYAQYRAKPEYEKRMEGVSEAIDQISVLLIQGGYSVEALTPCDYRAWRDNPKAEVLVNNDDVFVAIIPGRNDADYVGIWISN